MIGFRKGAAVCAAVIAVTCAMPAQLVGSPLPPARLHDWANTRAKTLAEFRGRTLLLEFFMYW